MGYDKSKYDPKVRADRHLAEIWCPETRLKWDMSRLTVLGSAKGVDLAELNRRTEEVLHATSENETVTALNRLYCFVANWAIAE